MPLQATRLGGLSEFSELRRQAAQAGTLSRRSPSLTGTGMAAGSNAGNQGRWRKARGVTGRWWVDANRAFSDVALRQQQLEQQAAQAAAHEQGVQGRFETEQQRLRDTEAGRRKFEREQFEYGKKRQRRLDERTAAREERIATEREAAADLAERAQAEVERRNQELEKIQRRGQGIAAGKALVGAETATARNLSTAERQRNTQIAALQDRINRQNESIQKSISDGDEEGVLTAKRGTLDNLKRRLAAIQGDSPQEGTPPAPQTPVPVLPRPGAAQQAPATTPFDEVMSSGAPMTTQIPLEDQAPIVPEAGQMAPTEEPAPAQPTVSQGPLRRGTTGPRSLASWNRPALVPEGWQEISPEQAAETDAQVRNIRGRFYVAPGTEGTAPLNTVEDLTPEERALYEADVEDAKQRKRFERRVNATVPAAREYIRSLGPLFRGQELAAPAPAEPEIVQQAERPTARVSVPTTGAAGLLMSPAPTDAERELFESDVRTNRAGRIVRSEIYQRGLPPTNAEREQFADEVFGRRLESRIPEDWTQEQRMEFARLLQERLRLQGATTKEEIQKEAERLLKVLSKRK